MTNGILNRDAVTEEDLAGASTTRKYEEGLIIKVRDSDAPTTEKQFIYAKSHGALTAFVPYLLQNDGSNVITQAPATGAGLIVVPQFAVASGSYAFMQIKGACSILMTAETYAVGDELEVINAGAAALVNGTSGATVQTVGSIGVATAAGTTAVANASYLYGFKADIAAA